MVENENLNSIAADNLFHHRNLMIFCLEKLTSFKYTPNLKNLLINKVCNIVAINKLFNIITVNLHSILFLFDIFNYLIRIFKNVLISNNLGGGKLRHGLNI
jgi:hypothetical protein